MFNYKTLKLSIFNRLDEKYKHNKTDNSYNMGFNSSNYLHDERHRFSSNNESNYKNNRNVKIDLNIYNGGLQHEKKAEQLAKN